MSTTDTANPIYMGVSSILSKHAKDCAVIDDCSVHFKGSVKHALLNQKKKSDQKMLLLDWIMPPK